MGGPPDPWTDQAIRDTVTAITRDPSYGRVASRSLVSRLLGWIGDRLQEILEQFRGNPVLQRVAIALLVLVAVVLVARWVIEWRTSTEDAEADDGRARVPGGSPWHLAQREAAAGRFDAAAHALFEAVIAALARQGAVRVHPSKTIGDYARELATRRHPLAGRFRALRQHYERCIYGDRRVTADDYAALLTLAEPMLAVRAAAA
ncbi:MAG: DUF4129 domain-containing protein [Gemmatimonadota bacterium]|jgi:hypothetical protein|nr:DUF4129 domain-containing protein [Gemmatimonadota bacterium]